MRITCPHCEFEKEIAAEQVPANVVRVTCPECRQPFPLIREETLESAPTVEDVSSVEVKTTTTAVDDSIVDGDTNDNLINADTVETDRAYSEERTSSEHDNHTDAPSPRSQDSEPACGEPAEPACSELVEPASISARYAALLIDGMLIMIMVMILRSGLVLIGNGIQLEGQLLLGVIFMLFALTLSFAYHTLFIGICGQTPGKMLLRIRVKAENSSALTYRQAMLREVLGKTLSLPLLLGYLMAMFNPRHLAAHDKIADTCVVKLTTETTAD